MSAQNAGSPMKAERVGVPPMSLTLMMVEVSRELTHRTVTANLVMREIGFKPYVAPALSSGALSILLTLRGAWHCGSVFLDGVFMGVKNRYTPAGVETELLPRIPDPLFGHIREAAEHLKSVL